MQANTNTEAVDPAVVARETGQSERAVRRILITWNHICDSYGNETDKRVIT